MKKLNKFLDQYLFAPARYLKADGDLVHAGTIKNFVSLPETKVAALTAAFIAVAATAADQKDKAFTAGAALGGTFIADAFFRSLRRPNNRYFFDTDPIQKQPIPKPAIEFILTIEKQAALQRALSSSFYRCAGAAMPITVMDTSLGTTATLCAIMASSTITAEVAKGWRAKQALDGNWNVITHKPERVEQTAPKFAKSLQPSPT